MSDLADTHVHLLAGLDDGPASMDEALAMCRMLVAEGVRHATALAHENGHYPENSPEQLLAAAARLQAALAASDIPLSVVPTAEVMLGPSLLRDWESGRVLSYGNHKKYLLVEMPHGVFVDLLPFANALQRDGVRLVIAHAERYPPLLDDPELAFRWITAGCLIQVTSQCIAEPFSEEMERGLCRWLKGGFVHVLGTDGHGIDSRQPRFAAGYRALVKLIGRRSAARIGSLWGTALLRGEPLTVPPPTLTTRSWFTWLSGR